MLHEGRAGIVAGKKRVFRGEMRIATPTKTKYQQCEYTYQIYNNRWPEAKKLGWPAARATYEYLL